MLSRRSIEHGPELEGTMVAPHGEDNTFDGTIPEPDALIGSGDARSEGKSRRVNGGVSGFAGLLIRKGIVSRDLVEEAAALKRSRGDQEKRFLHQILIDDFGADREQVFAEFVAYYSFKSLNLREQEVTAERLSFINKTLDRIPPGLRDRAIASKILPYQTSPHDATKLQLVTPDPTNAEIGTIGSAFPYPKYEIVYASLREVEELMRELVVDSQHRPSTRSVDYIEEEPETLIEELDEEIRKGHLNELVDNIFIDAVRLNASDIHIIPRSARRTEIHFRVDGHLTLWQTIDDLRADAVAAVIKDIAKGTDRFERNTAQDGFVQRTVDNKIVRFRVSIIPLMGRELKVKLESIVLRVLRDPEASITIDTIGFDPSTLQRFRQAIEKPYGIVILTGPTGSGKSTTLLAALRAVMDPSLNILTVEDPVEYLIDGARQVKLNPKLDFDQALRAILRHDPDIVMVGEIRDRITADLAVKLANTGHLTFTTLHTNDAPSAIARLYKMGIEPFLLAYSLNMIIAQRLVRKLCERCKEVEERVPDVALQKIGFPKDEIPHTTFYRAVGCIHCLQGYKGRTAIHEGLYFTPAIRQLIMEAGANINEESIRQTARREGMRLLRESGLDLLRRGVTTIEEIASTTAME